jgi:1-deoxy-D-xylulose-5-phosphate reductoisomerase
MENRIHQQEQQGKRLAILGSTGSIGRQALEVLRQHPGAFVVEVLAALENWSLLIEQALEFKPRAVVIAREGLYEKVADALRNEQIQVYAGLQSVKEIAGSGNIDLVLLAVVGSAGLEPALAAIEAGTDLALANKESLVSGGSLLMRAAKKSGSAILPVDSEHSAVFQCLRGERHANIEKVILTASGGPFRTFSSGQLEKVSPAQALQHPNWNMGCKISIDSASLMNKGLELIEARWLFGLDPAQLEVVIHPQSIVHSMVQFTDGSIKAQLGLPDMKTPIMYALSWPKRMHSLFPRFSFSDYPRLDFEPADPHRFPNLRIAMQAMQRSGNVPCVMNAANEVAVAAFLQKKLRFMEMPELIEQVIQKVVYIPEPALEDILQSDRQARVYAKELLSKYKI